MKIEATFIFDFQDHSKVEVDAFMKVMREYTLIILKLDHIRGKNQEVSEAMREEYLVMRASVSKALIKCFADNPVELDNLVWDSTNFVSREEQACLFAPPG